MECERPHAGTERRALMRSVLSAAAQALDLHVVIAVMMFLLLKRIAELIGGADGRQPEVARLDAADMQGAIVEHATEKALLDIVARQLLDIHFLRLDEEKPPFVNQPLGGQNDFGGPAFQEHPEIKPE